jgi:hypothetical protein
MRRDLRRCKPFASARAVKRVEAYRDGRGGLAVVAIFVGV